MSELTNIASLKNVVAPALDPALDSVSRRILLVDDDIPLLAIYSEVLIRSGYTVDTAIDGVDAWRALQSESYDLLITDNMMPNLTGPELIKRMRSENMTLPVILISGIMLTEDLDRRPWFYYARLKKPFTVEELLAAVTNALTEADVPADTAQLFRDGALLDDKKRQALLPADAPIRDPSDPPQRILVVDDNRDTRQLNMDVLTNAGYAVEGAKDGAAGWQALRTNGYDLVVTDNQMPNMTGIEMIEKLRSAHMEVPIIMATGILPTQEFARKPWLKPDAMLQRPFTNLDLLETVRNVLRPDDGSDDGGETLLPKYL